MTVKKVGDWNAARAATAAMATRMHRAQERASRQEAQLFRALVVRAFNSGGKSNGKPWEPLKDSTVLRKGSSKPLIDRGDLRNSVVVVEQGNSLFVGVPSKAKRQGGGPLVDIASVHEYGKVIAQQRGGSVVLIRIPERSFIRATAKKHFEPGPTRTRYFARVAIAMGAGWAVQAPPSAATMAKRAIGGGS